MHSPHVRMTARLAGVALATALAALPVVADAQAEARGHARPPAALPPSEQIVVAPLVWSVVASPVVPVHGSDGRVHLAYELFVANLSADTVRVHAIDVVDPARGNRVVAPNRVVDVQEADVSKLLRRLARPRSETTLTRADYTDRLDPGGSGLFYVHLEFADRDDPPRALAHRVTMSTVAPPTASPSAAPAAAEVPADAISATGALVEIETRRPIVLSPPLKGDRWLDADGCCRIIGPHRYTLLPIAGTQRAAEHFAIDFVQLDAQGRLFVGDPKQLGSWVYYGADVVAAGAGTVVQVRGDLPDQVPGQLPASITADTAAGNHVIVDMGAGQFALYAHMIPGSLAVQVGQRVARGERLGRLGNSGNTDAPHLHFHVMNSPSALETVGLPFVFDRMVLQGRLVGSLAEINDQLFAGTPPQIDLTGSGPLRQRMPLSKDLLGF